MHDGIATCDVTAHDGVPAHDGVTTSLASGHPGLALGQPPSTAPRTRAPERCSPLSTRPGRSQLPALRSKRNLGDSTSKGFG